MSFFVWKTGMGKLEQNDGACNVIIRLLSKNEDWEVAKKLGLVELGTKWFRLMLDSGVAPNDASFSMLMGLYRKGWNIEEAEFTFYQMRQFGILFEPAYSGMITIYTRFRLYEKAEDIISLMREDKIVPNMENWLVILNAYSQQGRLRDAEKVLVSMQEAGFSPNIVAYNIMITGYGKASNMDTA
ncbi:hypothetical protein AHAS_Ahas16G0163300 [Arachis hypogaea]